MNSQPITSLGGALPERFDVLEVIFDQLAAPRRRSRRPLTRPAVKGGAAHFPVVVGSVPMDDPGVRLATRVTPANRIVRRHETAYHSRRIRHVAQRMSYRLHPRCSADGQNRAVTR